MAKKPKDTSTMTKTEIKEYHKQIREYYTKNGWRNTIGHYNLSPTAASDIISQKLRDEYKKLSKENKKAAKKAAKPKAKTKVKSKAKPNGKAVHTKSNGNGKATNGTYDVKATGEYAVDAHTLIDQLSGIIDRLQSHNEKLTLQLAEQLQEG